MKQKGTLLEKALLGAAFGAVVTVASLATTSGKALLVLFAADKLFGDVNPVSITEAVCTDGVKITAIGAIAGGIAATASSLILKGIFSVENPEKRADLEAGFDNLEPLRKT